MTTDRTALNRLAARLLPGAHILRRRRLPGGVSSRMDRLDIAKPDGTTLSVSLRRSAPQSTDHAYVPPENMARDFAILKLIEAIGLPAPRPLLLDTAGEFFGVAAMVLSHLEGRPSFGARNPRAWTAELARALTEVHAVSPSNHDLSALNLYMRDAIRNRLADWRDNAQEHPLADRVHTVLEATLDRIGFSSPVLIHGDYWAGNTIWQRGKLTGIVDWSTATLGDPRIDVSECRMSIVFSHNISTADQFATDYERLTGRDLPDIWFFDLYRCLWPVIETDHYLEGAHDLGQKHLKLTDVEPRLHAFVDHALQQAAHA